MKKQLRNLAICVALGATPFYAAPVLCQAQQQVDQDQRAYQMGYQKGVNDAQSGKAMDMTTDDWHGNRVNIYQKGYQKGYDSVKGYTSAHNGPDQYQGEDRRAYEAGYQNGVNDATNNRNMNVSTDNWHGDRVNIYQQAYRQGYSSVKGYGQAHPMAEHGAYGQGYNPNQYQGEDQRAYETGYQNGVNDAQRNRAMNPNTDDWHGDRLSAYQTGYDQGYHSVNTQMPH